MIAEKGSDMIKADWGFSGEEKHFINGSPETLQNSNWSCFTFVFAVSTLPRCQVALEFELSKTQVAQ